MKRILLLMAVIIGLTSCNNTAKTKQETEELATTKTEKIKKILLLYLVVQH